ncbi:thiolase domain-containing protein [Sesbania bispinosa]|nr:thiolase domain-containing protein [Sesbania bispinosa]
MPRSAPHPCRRSRCAPPCGWRKHVVSGVAPFVDNPKCRTDCSALTNSCSRVWICRAEDPFGRHVVAVSGTVVRPFP